jgi:DNA-binding transcriptional LysR family regulator
MELRHLRYLVAIADAGAFVRAAERLRVAQPALTRQMHDLEEELGAPLFESGARRATLTLAGKACVRLARHVIHDTEQAVARARLSNSGIIGRCVIATGPLPLASGLLPQFLARMRVGFPGITLVILELAGQDQWNAVDRAEADIGLGGEPTPNFLTLSAAMQHVDKIDCVAVSAQHPLAGRDEVHLTELAKLPFLMLEVGVSPVLERIIGSLESAMSRNGPVNLERRQFPSIESLAAHIRAGQGWTLAPASLGPLLPGVALVKITGFQAALATMRIWRRAETRPVVLTVLDQLRRFQENRETESTATPASADPEVVSPRLELRHLRSFLAVAEFGSLGRAAEVIGVTQPALSRQMRELEYDVGVALFSRESRGMDITTAGETFRDDVADVLSVVDKIPQELRRAARGQTQRCVIAVVPHPVVDKIVARSLAELEAPGEGVRVGTRMVMSPAQVEALQNGDVDIGLGHTYPVPKSLPAGEHIITVPLFDDRISAALLPKSHPLATRSQLEVRELADIPFIWTGRDFHPSFYDVVFGELARWGLRPRVDREFDGLTTIWSCVLQGGGWTLGWRSHLDEPPLGLAAIPLANFDLPWGVVMSYRQDESRVPVLATIDALMGHATQLSAKSSEAVLPGIHTSKVRIS